jgi:hypothetical protein
MSSSDKILIWNLLDLLRETDNVQESDPDRVLSVNGSNGANSIVVTNRELLYVRGEPEGTKFVVVKRDFWGRLLK